MASETGHIILGITASLIGLAALAIVLSQKSNTTGVLNAGLGGFQNLITAVFAPITGGSSSVL